jgi:hypothetical protein
MISFITFFILIRFLVIKTFHMSSDNYETLRKYFFVIQIKQMTYKTVESEFESIEGGGFYSSGETMIFTSKTKWLYLLGLPIVRLKRTFEDPKPYVDHIY